jgi:DNA damage-inducible protein 1
MLLVILFEDDTYTVEISSDRETVDVLRQIIAIVIGKPSIDHLSLLFNDRLIDQGSVGDYGLSDGDVLILTAAIPREGVASSSRTASSTSAGAPAITLRDLPGNVTPDDLLSVCHANSSLMTELQYADPELHAAVAANDLTSLRAFMMNRFFQRHKEQYAAEQEEAALMRDPDNPENQRKMLERIERSNIQENWSAAMENLPESFASVHMLYINIDINGHPIKAFVDSGAQSTIMSKACAERCGVLRLLDTRYAGEARGVGTGVICGRIHLATMRAGTTYFPLSITVLETSDVDFLFGLDNLKRHRCVIDLSQNCLLIEGASGVERLDFLAEQDLPTR